jgi:hypothetical protein
MSRRVVTRLARWVRRYWIGLAGILTAAAVAATVWAVDEVRQSDAQLVVAVIGNDVARLAEERDAGFDAKVVELRWDAFEPFEGVKDVDYIRRKRAEFERLRRQGFKLILTLGFHRAPAWIHERFPDTYYVNQYGERYDGPEDSGELNLVFNEPLRRLAAEYLRQVFQDFGTDFYAVRIGGGRFAALTYPPGEFGGRQNCYWAFDRNAQRGSPTPGWKPGSPAPAGEAAQFVDYYLEGLARYERWQIAEVRRHFGGRLFLILPSWGIRPGRIEEAVEGNLAGATPVEKTGELQQGLDFSRLVAAVDDDKVVVTTTWLEADVEIPPGAEDDKRFWDPARYIAYLAENHPLDLAVFGETSRPNQPAALELAARRVKDYDLAGMAWFDEASLFSGGGYATLDDVRRVTSSILDR